MVEINVRWQRRKLRVVGNEVPGTHAIAKTKRHDFTAGRQRIRRGEKRRLLRGTYPMFKRQKPGISNERRSG